MSHRVWKGFSSEQILFEFLWGWLKIGIEILSSLNFLKNLLESICSHVNHCDLGTNFCRGDSGNTDVESSLASSSNADRIYCEVDHEVSRARSREATVYFRNSIDERFLKGPIIVPPKVGTSPHFAINLFQSPKISTFPHQPPIVMCSCPLQYVLPTLPFFFECFFDEITVKTASDDSHRVQFPYV